VSAANSVDGVLRVLPDQDQAGLRELMPDVGRTSAWAASVGTTPRPTRWNKVVDMLLSRSRTCSDSDGWAKSRASAAFVNDPYSTVARKQRSWCNVTKEFPLDAIGNQGFLNMKCPTYPSGSSRCARRQPRRRRADKEGGAVVSLGFVGLGNMGGPMCRRLARAGYQVRAFDLDHAKVADAVATGAVAVDSAAACASSAEIFLTSLPRPDHVESVMIAGGALAALQPGAIWVDLTTNRIQLLAELAQRAPAGVRVVDSPVTGAVDGARTGQLTLFAGGDPMPSTRSPRS